MNNADKNDSATRPNEPNPFSTPQAAPEIGGPRPVVEGDATGGADSLQKSASLDCLLLGNRCAVTVGWNSIWNRRDYFGHHWIETTQTKSSDQRFRACDHWNCWRYTIPVMRWSFYLWFDLYTDQWILSRSVERRPKYCLVTSLRSGDQLLQVRE